jgi:hypothetical protein
MHAIEAIESGEHKGEELAKLHSRAVMAAGAVSTRIYKASTQASARGARHSCRLYERMLGEQPYS